jgi:signal transduction histidine kinase
MRIQTHQDKESTAIAAGELQGLLDLPLSLAGAAPAIRPSAHSLIDATLDAMPTHVAILDGEGKILLVNKAWRYFAAALEPPPSGHLIGVAYLKSGILGALDRRDALMLRVTLKAMLRGDIEYFQHVIRMTGTNRWYQMTAARFQNAGAVRIVMTHENISAVHAAQETIRDLSQRLLDLQEQERHRIAIELHDSTAQQLTAIGLGLIALRRRFATDAAALHSFDEIESLVQEAQKEIRTFSYLLHPPYLDRDGLKQTLIRFIEGYGRRTGLAVLAEIADTVDRPGADVQRALLRIVQEALANVHRHASATEVTVRISATRRRLMFSVADNGKGMSRSDEHAGADVQSLGVGLPGMHTRVKQLGGALEIASGPGGTTVSGKIPLVGTGERSTGGHKTCGRKTGARMTGRS